MTDVETRLVALEARVRELEAAKQAAPFEWAEYVRLRQLPPIFIGSEWIGPQ